MAMLAPSDGYVVAINFPHGRAITQNSEVVVVIRKNTAATMEGTCMFRQRGGARGERR